MSVAESATMPVIAAAGIPVAGPAVCADATCGKGVPSAPSPVPAVALVGVLAAAAFAIGSSVFARRRHDAVATLPVGVPSSQFRPPKFA
jgi:hypothetical protein